MKPAYALVVPALLVLAGCKPTGHGVRQTMFHKDIYLNIPSTDFKETNRRSIHVLPHTWVNIKRINAVLADGTVIPCRDFQTGAFELVQDDNSAQLIGTLDLPVPDVAEVTVVIGKTGQCSGAEESSLSPCILETATPGNNNASAATSTDETTLTYTLPSRDRDSTTLVLQLKTNRDKQLPKASVPVTLTSTGQLPITLDVIDTPWLSLTPVADATTQHLPYGLLCPLDLSKTPITFKGTVDPDTKALTPMVMFDLGAPTRIAIGGTVVRLDIDKKTFQLRVTDTTDSQPYGTLFFRVGEQTSYAFTGGASPVTATFDDISIGRKIWVSVLNHPDPDERLDALDIQILDRNAPQR